MSEVSRIRSVARTLANAALELRDLGLPLLASWIERVAASLLRLAIVKARNEKAVSDKDGGDV